MSGSYSGMNKDSVSLRYPQNTSFLGDFFFYNSKEECLKMCILDKLVASSFHSILTPAILHK